MGSDDGSVDTCLVQPAIEEESFHEVALRGLMRELERYESRLRIRQRQIDTEPDQAKAAAMQQRLDRYRKSASEVLGRIWREVETMRRMEQRKRVPLDFAHF
jgi:hypothetical protein